ncbi:hypothetical protein RIR_jg1322.t2 [Rhizophagus irregularis DAOM 181602=DAOM 197198]|nr:hypothetical protein RIR_jg1322.t2 [Rhizophagus irregularis DAOM 181602=DAOM 197198]
MIPYSLAQSQYSVNFLLRGIPVIYLVAQRWTLVFLLVYKRTFRRKGSVNGDTFWTLEKKSYRFSARPQ